jgi:tetratricopeptide (TPR) repeat protein
MLIYWLAALVAAEIPAASAPPVAPMTAQAAFNAATAAGDAGRHAEAVALFTDLEKRPAVQRNPAVLGTIYIRKGIALGELGKPREAEAALLEGLKLVPATIDTYRGDLFLAHLALARMALIDLKYARALTDLAAAEPLADNDETRIKLLILQARATMFDEGGVALGYADKALAIAESSKSIGKPLRADLRTLHARALLNHGRAKEAYAELRKAVSDQGGLDYKVGLSEVVTRSDVAIAALLNGDDETARKYLAYTGAGRWEKAPFATAIHMGPPDCGGAADLRPEDVAVVEFNILEDGSIGSAQPIYSSRLGPAALEFARVVSSWSWKPEDAVAIPQLFRVVTRVELRCTTSADRAASSDPLRRDLASWLEAQHVPPFEAPASDAAAFVPLKAELARRLAAGPSPAAVPLLLALADNGLASDIDRQGWLVAARDIAIRGGAPLAARIYLEIQLANLIRPWKYREVREQKARLRELLALPDVREDARISADLKLLIASADAMTIAPADARTLLQQIVDDKRLPDMSAEKVGALVRIAAIEAKLGNVAAARASYERTGLSAQQCALFDARPALRRTNVSSSDFPTDAMRWGFEGWTKTEYDIMADGHTARQRTIVAYPPFVFRDAGVAVARKLLFTTSYRPDGDAGCTGASDNISFKLPG